MLKDKSFNPRLLELAKYLIAEQGKPADIAARKVGATAQFGDDGAFTGFDWGAINPSAAQVNNANEVLNKTTALQDISQGVSAGQLGQLGLGAAMQHPFKTMGLIGSAAGNIGGLTDNDKFGGQIAGLGLGGLGAYALAQGNPYMAAMMTMGGGNLGALFDKLRARKEQEQQQGYPNAGNPVAMMGRR